MGRTRWSRVPRIYTVLRRIGQLQLLDAFIAQGITDIWLPFSASSLPELLSPSSRADFLRIQSVALTKAIDLEKGELGHHIHLRDGEPLPFKTIGILGKGGYGQVDKVLSLTSFNEFALKRIRRPKLFGRAKEPTKTFEAELEVLKRLKHRHTVELIGSYTDRSYLGLLMSPVADCDMSQFLSPHPMSADSKSLLRSFFGCLSTALAYLPPVGVRTRYARTDITKN
jgi:serine/threonine protein kinase